VYPFGPFIDTETGRLCQTKAECVSILRLAAVGEETYQSLMQNNTLFRNSLILTTPYAQYLKEIIFLFLFSVESEVVKKYIFANFYPYFPIIQIGKKEQSNQYSDSSYRRIYDVFICPQTPRPFLYYGSIAGGDAERTFRNDRIR